MSRNAVMVGTEAVAREARRGRVTGAETLCWTTSWRRCSSWDLV